MGGRAGLTITLPLQNEQPAMRSTPGYWTWADRFVR